MTWQIWCSRFVLFQASKFWHVKLLTRFCLTFFCSRFVRYESVIFLTPPPKKSVDYIIYKDTPKHIFKKTRVFNHWLWYLCHTKRVPTEISIDTVNYMTDDVGKNRWNKKTRIPMRYVSVPNRHGGQPGA